MVGTGTRYRSYCWQSLKSPIRVFVQLVWELECTLITHCPLQCRVLSSRELLKTRDCRSITQVGEKWPDIESSPHSCVLDGKTQTWNATQINRAAWWEPGTFVASLGSRDVLFSAPFEVPKSQTFISSRIASPSWLSQLRISSWFYPTCVCIPDHRIFHLNIHPVWCSLHSTAPTPSLFSPSSLCIWRPWAL